MDITNINIWSQNYGVLPIHLNPIQQDNSFVMLNGGYGDFCLQTIPNQNSLEQFFSKSWSSNTKNFVVLDENKVKIYNWARNKYEEIDKIQVVNNFDKFYSYLLSKTFRSEKDVVPFIIDIFRQFRNITMEETNPVEALNLLFILLTSLEENYSDFNNEKWNVKETYIPDGFDFFADKINTGINNIKPEFELIIRHSSGVLFQEAQKEVLFFNPQRDLFGGVSNKLETKANLYSSIHYTPPYLARTIVENALKQVDLKKEKLKIFDPACGSSEFLIETLKQLRELNYPGKIEISGWDSSETAINTSNFLLKYEQRTIWNDKLDFETKLVIDSLEEVWETDNDIILMNPPFFSWELLNKTSKEAVRDTLNSSFSGRPNQASAFFYKAVLSLNETGVIGCVVPSSLLTLDAYKKLRVEIFDLIDFSLIGKLGNFIFEDALTDVSLIIGKKPKTNNIPLILWTKNEKGIAQNALRDLRKMIYSGSFSINEKDYNVYNPFLFPLNDNWKPISLKENEMLKTIKRFVSESKLFEVKDIFKVQQGINSGDSNLFKIKPFEFEKLLDFEKINFRPVIDNNAIKNGTITLENYIWYPYNSDGIYLFTEDEFKEKSPWFFERIYQHKEKLIKRPSIQPDKYWHLSRYRTWLVNKEPRLFSTRFGNSDSFAFDLNGDYVVENGNAWIPRKKFNLDDFYFYTAIFSSNLFDKLLSIYSRQLSGGKWYDLGGKYTNNIPIPNVHSEDVRNSDAYKRLVEIGKDLSIDNLYLKNIADEILTKYFYPEL
mgnify:CR=1 FL=1